VGEQTPGEVTGRLMEALSDAVDEAR
jgi:hypothetical protein